MGLYIASEPDAGINNVTECRKRNCMKNVIVKICLILGYCVPFVFLAMNEDATTGTLWFYLIMIIGFGSLCFGCIKIKSPLIVVIGNILSFISTCIFAWVFKTEKWEYYFKPFLPNQLIVFESTFTFLIQIIFVIHYKIKRQK